MSEKGVLDPYNLADGYELKMSSFEKELLIEALQQSGGNQSAAARLLGITERHLRSRLERTGLK
jgi:DNA-binding protein Fis